MPGRRKSLRGLGADAFFAPVSQHTSEALDHQDSKLVKVTFYLNPELVLKLERLRLQRLEQGKRVDKSALVREAIERLTE